MVLVTVRREEAGIFVLGGVIDSTQFDFHLCIPVLGQYWGLSRRIYQIFVLYRGRHCWIIEIVIEMDKYHKDRVSPYFSHCSVQLRQDYHIVGDRERRLADIQKPLWISNIKTRISRISNP